MAGPALAFAAILAVQGCSNTSTPNVTSGARDTGTFPNLNVAPTPAAAQISDAEKTDRTRALMDAQKRAAAAKPQAPPNDTAELRRLARSHAGDALKQIEVAE